VISLNFISADRNITRWSDNNRTNGYYTDSKTDWPIESNLTNQDMYVDMLSLSSNSGADTFGATGPLPTATAWDHHEGNITANITKENVILYAEQTKCNATQSDFSLVPCGATGNLITYTANSTESISQSNWTTTILKRAEYIAHWNVQDSSENDADTVAYSIIMTDDDAPTMTEEPNSTYEWSSSATLGPQYSFTDNYDDVIGIMATSTLTVSGADAVWIENGVSVTIPACIIPGNYTVTINVSDSAGIFGKDQENNYDGLTRTVTVEDTTPPEFNFTDAATPATTFECGVDTIPAHSFADFILTKDGSWETDNYHIIDVVDFTICNKSEVEEFHPELSMISRTGDCNQFNETSNYTAEAVSSCTATYQATDKAQLNSANQTLVWSVVDTTAPVITGTHANTSDPAYSDSVISHYHYANGDQGSVTNSSHRCDKNRATDGSTLQGNVSRLNGNHIIHNAEGVVSDASLTTLQNQLLDLTCQDACDNSSPLNTSWKWVDNCVNSSPDATNSKPYDITVPGEYILQFTCSDLSQHTSTQCRTVKNEDASKPIIDIKCKDDQNATGHGDNITIPASDEDFIDVGAFCYSYKYGTINANVETSGDIVNLAVSGTYMITYNCEDSDGVDADAAVRTVTVTDACGPVCSMDDCEHQSACAGREAVSNCAWANVTVEASFPYDDVAPNCTDESQVGNIAVLTTGGLEGCTINCAGVVDVEQSGTYILTYSVTDTSGNNAQYLKTVVVEDTMKPSITLNYDGADLVGLMEENHFVNGWLVGAVVSAITGVAMLAHSSKTSVATSVPV